MFNTLKKVFTSTPVLIYYISNTQIIVETNISEYILTVLLSIITEEKEVYPVVFHSYIFKAVEPNYNIYNKKLLMVFKAFHI